MKNKLKYLTLLLANVLVFSGISQDAVSINKSIGVVHIVDTDNSFGERYISTLSSSADRLPSSVYKNPISSRIIKTSSSGKKLSVKEVTQLLRENKVPNQVLNYLFSEAQDTLSLRLISERGASELTQYNLEQLANENLSPETVQDYQPLINRIVNSNYLLVYHHYGTKFIDKADTVQSEKSDSLINITRTKGYEMVHQPFLLRLSFADTVLNEEFYEKGWGYDEDIRSIKKQKKVFRDNMLIPIAFRGSEVKTVSSLWEKTETVKKPDGYLAKKNSASSKANGAKGLLNLTSTLNSKLRGIGTYDDQSIFSGLANKINTESQLKKFTESDIEWQTTSIVKETSRERKGRKVPSNKRGIRIDIGRQQGLRPNHRYGIFRAKQDKKSGVVNEKFLGYVMATSHLARDTRGVGNTQNTSKFIQTYGAYRGNIRQFDKAKLNRNLITFYGGYGTSGLNFKTDVLVNPPLFRKISYGQKIYLDLSADFLGQAQGLESEINISGTELSTNVTVLSASIGWAKEWYFLKRFIFGPFIGFRFVSASFQEEQVEELLVPAGELENYGNDWAAELGLRFGVRITRDFSVIVSGSANALDFDNSIFSLDNGAFPLSDYDEVIDFTIRYELPQFNLNN